VLRSFVELVKELAANDEGVIRVEYKPNSALKSALKRELQRLNPTVNQTLVDQLDVSQTSKAKALLGLLLEVADE